MPGLKERYTLGHQLGRGGHGTVHSAFDTELMRPVAIKLLRDDRSMDLEARVRLLREARALAQLAHPNVVAIHDVGTYDADGESSEGGVYIVMERIDGPDLKAWLNERLRPWREILDVFLQAARGVAAAHAAGFIHRDLKLSNIVIGADGRPRVLDFGLARASRGSVESESLAVEPPADFNADADADTLSLPDSAAEHPPRQDVGDDLTRAGEVIGTPRYMSPEHHGSEPVDERSDLFSFCASLFEALYQRPAFDGVDAKQLAANKRAGRIASRPETTQVPLWLDKILRQGLAPAPADRFESMTALLAAVESRLRPRSVAWWAAACLLVGGGIGLAVPRLTPSAPATAVVADPVPNEEPAAVERNTVALLPFEDETADPRLEFAREGFPDILGRELNGTKLRIIPYYRLGAHMEGAPDDLGAWREVAARLGAGTVVRGRLAPDGDAVSLEVVVEARDGTVLATVQRSAAVERLPAAVRECAAEIASVILQERVELAVDPKTSLEFDRSFQTGLSRLESGDHGAAEEHFRAAVTFAPDAGSARFYLALASWWADRSTETTLTEIELALASTDLSAAQRRFLNGLAQLVRREYAAAIQTFQTEFAEHPDDRYSGYGLFEAQYHGGRVSDAMQTYLRLGAAWPTFSLGLLHVLEYSLLQRDHTTLAWAMDRAQAMNDPMLPLWEARQLAASGDFSGARDRLQALRADLEDDTSAADIELLGLHLRAGELGMAETLAAQLEFEAPHPGRMLRLAVAHLAGSPRARADVRAALALSQRSQAPSTSRTDQAIQRVALEMPAAGPKETRALVSEFEALSSPEVTNRNAALLLSLLAGPDHEPTTATFPEVVLVQEARRLQADHKPKAAAGAWREAMRQTSHPALFGVIAYQAAQWQAENGEPQLVIDFCRSIIDPPVMAWNWASTVLPCLEWSATAFDRVGNSEAAAKSRATFRRLRDSAIAALQSTQDD